MYLNSADDYSPGYGLYCSHGDSEAEVEEALFKCRNGDETVTPREDTTVDNWAVEFKRTCECSLE